MQTTRQKEILEAALNLISDKGIQGLTIKNISREIGISEPAIYRHYDSKMDIMVAILEVFRQNTETLFTTIAEEDMPAVNKIHTLFTRHFESFAQTPSLVTVIFSEELFRADSNLSHKVSEIISANFKILIGIIKEGQKNNEIRNDVPADHIAIIIMGSLRLFIKKWQFAGYAYDIRKEGIKLIKSIHRLIYKGVYNENH